MVFGNDRTQIRRYFCDVYAKIQAGATLEPLEAVVAEIIEWHPEYHSLLADPEAGVDREFTPEHGQTNPFLHMGMHVAIREQLAADRPTGFRVEYQRLLAAIQDAHAVEHRIMECLGSTLWEAQRAGRAPDEAAYLDCVRRLTSARPR